MLSTYCTYTKPTRLPSEQSCAVIGNENRQNLIRMWFSETPRTMPLMVTGQIGCGKTSSIVNMAEAVDIDLQRFEFDDLTLNSMILQIEQSSRENCVVYIQNAQCVCLARYKHLFNRFIKLIHKHPNTVCEFDSDCQALVKAAKLNCEFIQFQPLLPKTLQKHNWTYSDIRQQKLLSEYGFQQCDQPLQTEKNLFTDMIKGTAKWDTLEKHCYMDIEQFARRMHTEVHDKYLDYSIDADCHEDISFTDALMYSIAEINDNEDDNDCGCLKLDLISSTITCRLLYSHLHGKQNSKRIKRGMKRPLDSAL